MSVKPRTHASAAAHGAAMEIIERNQKQGQKALMNAAGQHVGLPAKADKLERRTGRQQARAGGGDRAVSTATRDEDINTKVRCAEARDYIYTHAGYTRGGPHPAVCCTMRALPHLLSLPSRAQLHYAMGDAVIFDCRLLHRGVQHDFANHEGRLASARAAHCLLDLA